MLDSARHFFAERNILLVDTPMLSTAAVSDPNVESVRVTLGTAPDKPHYLQTSPEYAMKRLLADGFPDIGQICRVFRDGESGQRHQPEFTMIEWYRLNFGLSDIVEETVSLIAALLERADFRDVHRVSYRTAFREHAGIDPISCQIQDLVDAAQADAALRSSLGDNVDGWLDLLMSTKVAPSFDADRLTVVDHYPAAQAALARLCPDDRRVADRFEVFAGAIELANGYVELTDAEEQKRRFQRDQHTRFDRGIPEHPIDANFVQALEAGLPACAGVAVGFDRLLMTRMRCEDIRLVQHFPFGRQR